MFPTPIRWGLLCSNFSGILVELYMTSELILEEFIMINVIIRNAEGINKDFLLVANCKTLGALPLKSPGVASSSQIFWIRDIK